MGPQRSLFRSVSGWVILACIAAPLITTSRKAEGEQPKAVDASPKSTAPARAAPPAKSGGGGKCGAGMVEVTGEYCPDVEHVCLKWLDPPPYQYLRCAEYKKPAKCKVPRVHMSFCIDREEYAEEGTVDAASKLPVVSKSWLDAKAMCEARGARLCKEAEWEFACEGEEMRPYPHGFKRDTKVCNFDLTDLGGPNDKLKDHRAPLGAFAGCTSPFGVHNMTGNVDEWTEREGVAAPNRSILRGGWWLPGRNRCRAATMGHDESYTGKQVGFRCCK